MKIKELTEKEKAKFALRREADIYTSQRWWSRTFLSVTKETGVIGQLIIGTILAVIMSALFSHYGGIRKPEESLWYTLSILASFFPFFYTHKYTSKINKILTIIVFVTLTISAIRTFQL